MPDEKTNILRTAFKKRNLSFVFLLFLSGVQMNVSQLIVDRKLYCVLPNERRNYFLKKESAFPSFLVNLFFRSYKVLGLLQRWWNCCVVKMIRAECNSKRLHASIVEALYFYGIRVYKSSVFRANKAEHLTFVSIALIFDIPLPITREMLSARECWCRNIKRCTWAHERVIDIGLSMCDLLDDTWVLCNNILALTIVGIFSLKVCNFKYRTKVFLLLLRK